MEDVDGDCEYIDILVIHCNTSVIEISTSISIRLPDDMANSLESLSETIDRSKAYIIKKALQTYLEDYSEYLIAHERLNDKNDKVVSSNEMRNLIGLQD
jgi:RHH-type rel operon transcriptional repressor/antitoxin RelB